MDFTSINNINSYLKTMNMNNIWKQRVNSSDGTISGSLFKAKEETIQTAGAFGDSRLIGIKAKMQSGQKLSSDDLDYLRENDPMTYDEVIKMEREKKAYEKELSRCKTKDDARILHMGKVTATLVAVKSGTISAEVALAKLSKIAEAYEKFTESAHYSKLAENHTELEKAIEAEKAAITDKKEPSIAEQENDGNMVQPAEDAEELQDQLIESEPGYDPAGDITPAPQFAHSDKPKPVDTGSKPTASKVKTDAIPADAKPSFSPNREAVRAISELYAAETADGVSHNRLNHQI